MVEQVLAKLFAKYAYHQLGGMTHQLGTMQMQYTEAWNDHEEELGPDELVKDMRLLGLAALYNFWSAFSDFFATKKDGTPFIIPAVPFNKTEIEFKIKDYVIEGAIDAVFTTISGPVVVKWIYIEPYRDFIDIELEALLYAHAFRHKTRKDPVDIMVFYLSDGSTASYSGSDPSQVIRNYYLPTLRALEATTKFYPRPGLHCRRCPYQNKCFIENGLDIEGGLGFGRRRKVISPINRRTAITDIRRALEV